MSAAGLLLVAASTVALGGAQTVPQTVLAPAVVLFPSAVNALPGAPRNGALEETFRAGFEGAAQETWRERGYVVSMYKRESGPASAVDPDCRHRPCREGAARRLGAQLWASAELRVSAGDTCTLTARVFDRRLQRRTFDAAPLTVSPCTLTSALLAAEDLGQSAALGPRWTPPPQLALTPLSVPALEIRTIPDLPTRRTSSTAPGRAEALDIYQREHLMLLTDERQRLLVTQNGRLIGDCEVLRLAGQTPSPELLERCQGNNWEWAWLGFATGTFVMWQTGSTLEVEQPGLPFLFGLTLALASPILAWTLNEDAPGPGEHIIARHGVRAHVHRANARLRGRLALTDLEVRLAGMQL